LKDSLLETVKIDEVSMKYGISCEICGSQIALNFSGLEVRIVEEEGTYVALVQIPLPGDYLDSYLLEEYSRRYRLFLLLVEEGALTNVAYELRADIPSVVARSVVGSLAKAVELVEKIASVCEKHKDVCLS